MNLPPNSIFGSSRSPLGRQHDPETLRRRRSKGVMLILSGLALGGFGLYDLSIWKQVDSNWYGMPCFVIGAIALVGGIIFLALAFPKLFDSGGRGI
jgi:hypothetical protein